MQDDEPTGDAARAFEDLRAEVSVLRRAVESLSEEWEANQPPDYTESLGQITQGLSKVVGRLQSIEQHPALNATPAQYQAAILAAGRDLMSQAAGRIDQATDVFKREQQNLASVIGTVRVQRKQWEWLTITAASALLVGLLLSPFAARLLPFGWDAGVAATILHADRWSAGQALMKSTNPTGWATLNAEMNLAEANHDALTACREAAVRTKKEQRCTIVVPAL
jgi:ElaB/YqjD/DUF883 family membrane-anchored ribosome-binding protein